MGRRDEDFRAEIESHIALETDRLMAEGVDAATARDAAVRRFGNVAAVQERFYESRRMMWLDDLRQDAKYALRSFARTPAFTLVAILTIALGIGANTAIFSVVNAVLLRPLPYKDSERLVRILDAPVAPSDAFAPRLPAGVNMLELAALREQSKTLSHIGILQGSVAMTLTAPTSAVRLEGARLSPQLLHAVSPTLVFGRLFDLSEEMQDAGAVVILSHGTWQRHFGGDPNILGQNILLDGGARTVIAVTTADFRFPESRTAFWIPFQQPTGRLAALQRLVPIARLADGASLDAAREDVIAILSQSRSGSSSLTPPPPPPPGGPPPPSPAPSWSALPAQTPQIQIERLRDQLVGPVRLPLLVLAGAVGCVLLIACANVASLLLARTAARQREIAMRRALGAGSGRLIRQVLTESVMLALAGGVAGTLLAFGGVRLLRTLAPAIARRDVGPGALLPRIDEVGVDLPVLVFALAVALAAGVLFGLAPALRHVGTSPTDTLRYGTGSSRHGFSMWRGACTHGAFVVAEVALATMLFVGGALLIRSFIKLSSIDPGYDTANVLTFQVFLPRTPNAGVPPAFAADLVERLAAVPGLTAAGYSEQLPTRNGQTTLIVRKTAAMPLVPPPPPSFGMPAPPQTPDVRYVTPGFLDAMGIDVLDGQGFGDPRGPRAILINRAMARSGFLGEHPIGTYVYTIGQEPWEIRGIIDDVRQYDVRRDPDPQIFFDLRQLRVLAPPPGTPWPGRIDYFAIRMEGSARATVANVRALVRQIDRQAIVENVATMEQIFANSISRPRLYATVLGILAGVAISLAAIGIYGVMAYSVAQRVREVGIRMALGAEQWSVMRLVLLQSTFVTLLGLALGLLGAAALARFLTTMLYGLTPLDPATYIGVSILFALVATAAAFIPARRATRVDPLIALRCE
jgi:putative ABC transport system permease protein